MKGLAIKEVAERTGLTAGTIRMWEQRYGFPLPERTPSGYRVYSDADVAALKRVAAFRSRGLSVPASLERARQTDGELARPSIYGAIVAEGAPLSVHRMRKRTLLAISRAIEDETLSRGVAPVVVGAFQHVHNFRAVEHRYRRLARTGEVVLVFADFDAVSERPGRPIEVPISTDDAIGNEWAVVVDAPGYAACLLAWEPPHREDTDVADLDRRFECAWTIDPEVVRRAAQVSCSLVRRQDASIASRCEALLADRPLAMEAPAPALTALTNRMVAYMEG